MTLWQMLFSGTGALIVLMTLIQITPIKINPWTKLGTLLGRWLNGETQRQLADLQDKMASLEHDVNNNAALTRRTKILRFCDESINGKNHTKNHYDNILKEIDEYEKYCRENPDFQNSIITETISCIKQAYAEKIKTHSFLPNDFNDN